MSFCVKASGLGSFSSMVNQITEPYHAVCHNCGSWPRNAFITRVAIISCPGVVNPNVAESVE